MKNYFTGKKTQSFWIAIVITISLILMYFSAFFKSEAKKEEVKKMCEKLLANTVIEDYDIEIVG